jgi:hypothetical protein|tara:strand:- start:123 stop:488 length:366 start_codon:yes stop_codon:yes gene_type:complete
MGFKLGKESRKIRTSKNTPIVRKSLDKGILGEANMDGSIYIDKSVPEGSELEQKVIKHESDHAKRMKTGELSYGDDWVRFRGVTYPRKDGQILYKGKWREEGDDSFEWEKLAEKATKNENI